MVAVSSSTKEIGRKFISCVIDLGPKGFLSSGTMSGSGPLRSLVESKARFHENDSCLLGFDFI